MPGSAAAGASRPRSAPESLLGTRRLSTLRTTTLSTTMLPLATAAFTADWIVTPRVLEAEVGPLDAKGRTRRTSTIRQASVLIGVILRRTVFLRD